VRSFIRGFLSPKRIFKQLMCKNALTLHCI
jgi:hypothetical protein